MALDVLAETLRVDHLFSFACLRIPVHMMSDDDNHDVFELDEEGRRASGVQAGSCAVRDPVGPNEQDEASTLCALDPFRRAMPQVQADEDVCSICLDAFTDEDPANATSCE